MRWRAWIWVGAPTLAALSVGALAQSPAVCPPQRYRTQLMSPTAGRLPREGGFVVGLFPGGSHPDLPALSLVRRRREVPLEAVAIAPGLYRVQPSSNRLGGRWRLAGVDAETELLFGRGGPSAPPAQPVLDRVERYLVASTEGSTTEMRVRFRFPIPDGVVATTVYLDGHETPDFYAPAAPRRDEVLIWRGSGACDRPPGATRTPGAEGTLRVALIDRFGQSSRPSEPVSYGP